MACIYGLYFLVHSEYAVQYGPVVVNCCSEVGKLYHFPHHRLRLQVAVPMPVVTSYLGTR